MNPFVEHFENLEKWAELVEDSTPIDMKRLSLESVNVRNRTFHKVFFDGGTLSSSYFVNCKFVECSFNDAEFEDCTIENCVFSECDFLGVVFTGSNVNGIRLEGSDHVRVNLCSGSATGVRCTSIPLIDFSCNGLSKLDAKFSDHRSLTVRGTSCASTNLTLVHCDSSQIELADSTTFLELKATRLVEIVTTNGRLMLRAIDSQVENAILKPADELYQISSLNSVFSGIDLASVDLESSTFVASSLAGCKWPNQTGRTSILGRFVPPTNLLQQPVSDVGGVPDITHQEIRRSQSLNSLEKQAEVSFSTLIFQRLLGASTGHGRSPSRLLVFSTVPAGVLALCHMLAKAVGLGTDEVKNIGGIRDFLTVMWDYLTLIVSVGDRKDLQLFSGLEDIAWFFSLIFIGLIVTLFTNFIFRQG